MNLSEAIHEFRNLEEGGGRDKIWRKSRWLRKQARKTGANYQQMKKAHGMNARSQRATEREKRYKPS